MPMELGVPFSMDQCLSSANQVARMHGVPYIQAIGSVLWPVVVSRPDAVYAVGVMSQFMQNPGPAHWEGLKRIINYLGSMKDLWLTFRGCKETMIECFCDVDSWSSKKQGVVLLSSTEAEYIAQTHAAKEGIWLRSFIKEIQGEEKPLTISCDNQGAITLVKDNKFHARMKHIDLQYHFICEAVEDGKIEVKYVPTDDNMSDIFTKPLPRPKFAKFMESLGLRTLDDTQTKPRC